MQHPFLTHLGRTCVIVALIGMNSLPQTLCAAPPVPNPATFADPGPDVGDELPATQQKALRAIRSQEGAPAWLPTVVTASSTPTAFAARAGRRGVTVVNNDTTLTVYIGADGTISPGSANAMALGPGQSVPLDTTAAVFYVTASGSPKMTFIETFTPPAVGAAVTVQPPVIQ